jgi:hypothetical protein
MLTLWLSTKKYTKAFVEPFHVLQQTNGLDFLNGHEHNAVPVIKSVLRMRKLRAYDKRSWTLVGFNGCLPFAWKTEDWSCGNGTQTFPNIFLSENKVSELENEAESLL